MRHLNNPAGLTTLLGFFASKDLYNQERQSNIGVSFVRFLPFNLSKRVLIILADCRGEGSASFLIYFNFSLFFTKLYESRVSSSVPLSHVNIAFLFQFWKLGSDSPVNAHLEMGRNF